MDKNLNTAEELTLDEISKICSNVKEVLTRFNKDSEIEFLRIGSQLRTFLQKINKIIKLSSGLNKLVSDDILKAGISEFNILLDRFSDHLNHSISEIKFDRIEIEHISEHIDIALDDLSGFTKIIKHLRMLGISTKIESAKLGIDDKGFTALAENVDKLSGQISEKIKIVSHKILVLTNEALNVSSSLLTLENNQNSYSTIILNDISETLKNLDSNYRILSERANEIKIGSDGIQNCINDVITFIQFHDITRQQFEHVTQSMSELKKKLIQGNLTGCVKPEDLGYIHDICHLQLSQMSTTHNEFLNATAKIQQSILTVDKNIAAIQSLAERLLSLGDLQDLQSLTSIRVKINKIVGEIDRNSDTELKVRESIQTVIEIVNDLTEYINQIEEIGTEIEIISLNARVKAAHTGINGSALGTLAESIQSLSIETKTNTTITSNVLKDITKISDKLKSRISEEAAGILDYKNIKAQVDSIANLETVAGGMLKEIQESVKSLREDLYKAGQGITLNDKMEETTITVNNGLKELLKLSDGVSGEDKWKHTNDLYKNYTMESERKVHNEFLNKATLVKNKLFNNNIESEFGDNVELF